MISTLDAFQRHRPTLFALAYRMLGSRQDAEDILQDAYLKFQPVSLDGLESVRAYLITQVSRQCIDALRRARYREGYEGPWLPEPLIADAGLAPCPSELMHRFQHISQGILWMMERLSPVQRAVLVLRDVLDLSYDEIAGIIDKSAENCRQIHRRALQHLGPTAEEAQPPGEISRQWIERLISAFTNADAHGLTKLLHEDAILVSDGGGKVNALPRPLQGREGILAFLSGLHHYYRDEDLAIWTTRINNETGLLIYVNGQLSTTCTVVQYDGAIRYILMVRNPDKLHTVPQVAKNT